MRISYLLLCLLIANNAISQTDSNWCDMQHGLRFDFLMSGDATHSTFIPDALIKEPSFDGPHFLLVDSSNFGEYQVLVFDSAQQKILYCKGFCSLFSEWQVSAEASLQMGAFPATVSIPWPLTKIVLIINERDKKNNWQQKLCMHIDPKQNNIRKDKPKEYPHTITHFSGSPSERLDIAFLAEGYTIDEMDKFKHDVKAFADYLFSIEPYRSFKDRINIWAIETPSAESGTDLPITDKWSNTIFNSSFNSLGTERYLMISDERLIRNAAVGVPYDHLVVLCNSNEYGGGGIYNNFMITTAHNPYSKSVFAHELGHSFAGLADEYTDSDLAAAYQFDLNIEPWEPNVTTLVNFSKKWQYLVEAATPIPTSDEEKNKKTLGAYEGALYATKGIYRPLMDCQMRSAEKVDFCPVCKRVIVATIKKYCKN